MFQKLFLPFTVLINFSGDHERLLKFKTEGREFTNKILTEQFWKQNTIANSLISLFKVHIF